MYATQLKTNYLNAPVGITPGKVLLTWVPEEGIAQTAYQVQIYKHSRLVYDSGVISSGKSAYQPDLAFPGRTRYHWNVTLWDENNAAGKTAKSYFETGIESDGWVADWIDPETVQHLACQPGRTFTGK